MKLKSSPKIFENYKCDYPENTIKRIEDGFRKCNINSEYKEIRIKQGNFSTYSGRLFLLLDNFFGLDNPFSTNGKGLISGLSKASAYAEMAERFSSGLLFPGYPIPGHSDELNIQSKIKESDIANRFFNFTYLKGYNNSLEDKLKKAVLVREFFDEENRLLSTATEEIKQTDLLRHWVDAYSLTKKMYKKVPLKFIRRFSGTNGLASGNTIEEAIVHAINEILEHHVALKIIKNKIIAPTINVRSIKDKTALAFINFLKSINVDVIIKDFSMGNIFPCVGILLINNNLKDEKNKLKKNLYFKQLRVGSHLDRDRAIMRCFIEGLQGLSLEEFMFRPYADILWNYWTIKMKKKYNPVRNDYFPFIRRSEYCGDLSFLEEGPVIPLNHIFSFKSNDCLEEINKLVEICNKKNWEVLVVDETHPIINFPTVRVVIPSISNIFMLAVDDFGSKMIIEDNIWGEIIYGIKNISYYTKNSDWLKSKEKIKELMIDIENYLVKYLFPPALNFNYTIIPLLNILALANLAINDYKEALNYFTTFKEVITDKRKNFNEIYNFLKGKTELSDKNKFKKILNKLVGRPENIEIEKIFNNFDECSAFLVPPSFKNPFTDWCNDCEKHCGKSFYNKIESMIKTFF